MKALMVLVGVFGTLAVYENPWFWAAVTILVLVDFVQSLEKQGKL